MMPFRVTEQQACISLLRCRLAPIDQNLRQPDVGRPDALVDSEFWRV